MSKVLIATVEPIGGTMAGPAIRASHIARVAKARDHEVTLVSLEGGSANPITDGPTAAASALDDHYDVALLQGRLSLVAERLVASSTPVAFDWFDPFHLEALERARDDSIRRRDLVAGARTTLQGQALRGDFFVCSNDAQRNHWLGWLSAAGRCNPTNYDTDPTLRNLIDEASFGTVGGGFDVAPESPIRAEFAVVGADDPLIVWAGGLHDWLDPVTAVEAMPAVLASIPNARLVFLAGPHPNTSLEQMGVRGDAIERAKSLGLFGSNVLFVSKWVPYLERGHYLTSAHIGLVLSRPSIEAQLSHRTRLVDHLDAGLPTVTTRGEPFGDALIATGAAAGVTTGDARSLGIRLISILQNDAERERLSQRACELADTYRWERTLAPLMDWFETPMQAADRAAGIVAKGHEPTGMSRLIERTRLHAADGGAAQVARRAAELARRRLPQRRP